MVEEVKKILYFLDFPFCVGGSNKVLLTQAYIMKQKGYQVKVIIPNDEQGNHAEEYDRICDEYMLESVTAYYTVSTCLEEIDILAALDVYQNMVTLLEEDKPDLIHSTQLNIAVELAARKLKIPHLMNIYQVDKQAFHVKWMEVYPQYHSADTLMMSERWGNGLRIASKCIRSAYEVKNKVSREYENSAEICILSIGVLCKHKNQLECLKFISICKENGHSVRGLFFGDAQSVYGGQCKKYVEENGLQDNVQFIDFVSNLQDYYKSADLLIVSSKVESYPSVIIASMANKVSVLSTPVAGVPELLKDGTNGFLTSGYEAKDLYEAFLKYLEQRKSGQIIQTLENAYCTYLEQHTYKAVGNELEKYYQWIISDYSKKDISSLDVNQVRQKINEFISAKSIDRNQTIGNKIWLLYHILPILEQKENKKVMIWGAGLWGRIAFEWVSLVKNQIEFIGFIDSFKQGRYLGFPIINNNDPLIDMCGTIIIAILDEKSRLEIMEYLDMRGRERNKDYFLIWNGPIRL